VTAPALDTRELQIPEVGLGSEAAARKALRGQIARLDAQTSALVAEAFPVALDLPRIGSAGARIMSLAELEARRDAMANRLEDARAALSSIRASQQEARGLVEQMLADPKAYKWLRVSRDEAGLDGCGHWHVRPRLGLIGMLAGWWHVKISSGCP
jgi:hypothetical protein